VKRLLGVAAVAVALSLTGCSTTEVELTPTQTDGKCTQERTKTVLGIFRSQNEYIVNC
jgi:outer membrane lipoprotein SlyB